MNNKNPITIEVLEILDAIDRRGSFAKAAEELNKATSAISYGVQKLEQQLDIVLFQRQGRRSVLTPAGKLVLEEGRIILHSTARLALRAKELATGWEPRIRIAVETLQSYPDFFQVIAQFLQRHDTIELDINECVLNGGWEALAQDRVDLIVGASGPAPQHKGYRSISLSNSELVPVIAASHKLSHLANDHEALTRVLPELRRVVVHDTSIDEIVRSEGLSRGGKKLYVQNMNQKVEAILAGIGIGHLPRKRIQHHLDSGTLISLNLGKINTYHSVLAWKITNKGKGLRALTTMLASVEW